MKNEVQETKTEIVESDESVTEEQSAKRCVDCLNKKLYLSEELGRELFDVIKRQNKYSQITNIILIVLICVLCAEFGLLLHFHAKTYTYITQTSGSSSNTFVGGNANFTQE